MRFNPDATKFSETGYFGGDVELAERGINYLDEVDKIVARPWWGRDFSGRGVQTNLFQLTEAGDMPVVSPNELKG